MVVYHAQSSEETKNLEAAINTLEEKSIFFHEGDIDVKLDVLGEAIEISPREFGKIKEFKPAVPHSILHYLPEEGILTIKLDAYLYRIFSKPRPREL